jgi:hypothetical protein
MASREIKKELVDYWNSKAIVICRKYTADIDYEIIKSFKTYTLEELKALIDFYATILEKGTPEDDKIYYWTHQWNLWEFLRRGVKKFDGQELSNYKRRQRIESPEAIIMKR